MMKLHNQAPHAHLPHAVNFEAENRNRFQHFEIDLSPSPREVHNLDPYAAHYPGTAVALRCRSPQQALLSFRHADGTRRLEATTVYRTAASNESDRIGRERAAVPANDSLTGSIFHNSPTARSSFGELGAHPTPPALLHRRSAGVRCSLRTDREGKSSLGRANGELRLMPAKHASSTRSRHIPPGSR
jgi:hypothetical protein